ncbi:L,D-transpeptidase [Rhodopseudomonas boonkerdii]|uniref:L,D-transpeptidase n=1 Tax=Rhodopseudomonas boonkerdii TaxID=475937 RepID=UPI001E53CFD5|nr:L,D-transpeptidase [Rhodopseudomonas boonkerdii]UGV27974.1 L,D-transpeptidase [Rhodopseudomonas boonkerdii]
MSHASSRTVALRGASAFALAAALLVAPSFTSGASAQMMSYAPTAQDGFLEDNIMVTPEQQRDAAAYVMPERLRRAEVSYVSNQVPGTIVIDTGNTQLYYILGNNRAIRYGVGVGREGFTWAGTETVTRKAEWPDWHPPAEMIRRQPYLPRFMAGGPGNPLGARAMYLGSSAYRIHGTNDPTTIGKFVSSGCIRLTNEDVQDLFSRVSVGTKVVVLPKSGTSRHASASNTTASRTVISVRPASAQGGMGREAMNLSASSLY